MLKRGRGKNGHMWTLVHRKSNTFIHGYHLNGVLIPKPKKHKHENDNKHVPKQQGNNDTSSTLIMINFTPKLFFRKSQP